MRALIPLRMRWCCQITIDIAKDDALLDLMAQAGCALALIGFESLDRASLVQMRKKWNGVAGGYDEVVRRFHARGIMIYGTFVFGYDADTPASFDRAAAFALRAITVHRQFQSAHADARHRTLRSPARGRPAGARRHGGSIRPIAMATRSLLPRGMSTDELSKGPMRARRAFYGWRSIAGRVLRGAPMWRDPYKIGTMLLANWISRREIVRKQGRPLATRSHIDLAEVDAMKLTLIKPTIGRMTHSLYVDEARMEPLNLGVLAALTPEDVDVVMYDDRMEPIPYQRADRPGRDHGRDLHGAPLLRDCR